MLCRRVSCELISNVIRSKFFNNGISVFFFPRTPNTFASILYGNKRFVTIYPVLTTLLFFCFFFYSLFCRHCRCPVEGRNTRTHGGWHKLFQNAILKIVKKKSFSPYNRNSSIPLRLFAALIQFYPDGTHTQMDYEWARNARVEDNF